MLWLALDSRGETLFVVEVGKLKGGRRSVDRCHNRNSGRGGIAQDAHDGVGRHQIIERQLRIEEQLDGRSS